MEKRAVIEEGVTPPEKPALKTKGGEKKAGQDLADHTTKRLQDAADSPKAVPPEGA